MTPYDSVDRKLLVLGLLPLLVAAVWLVMLREPRPVAAHADGGFVLHPAHPLRPELVDERTLEAAQTRFLGLVVSGQEADLGTELSGQVVRVWAEAGARVRRGEPLVQLASLSMLGAAGMARAKGAEDRSAEQAAELSFEVARDKAERMDRAANAYSEHDLRAARLEAQRAKADLDKLQASSAVQRAGLRRDLARAKTQTVRAPFDGVLANRFVDAGDFVAAGTTLVRVIDDARFVRFAVPACHLSGLQVGAALRVGTRGAAALWSATVVNVQPELDAASGLGFARAELQPSPTSSATSAAAAVALVPGTRVDVMTGAGAGTTNGSP
jgi:RND family efflux transporter MFP subunit